VWAGKVLPARLSGVQIAFLFLLALPLSLHSMAIGQANLIVVGACLLGLAAIRGERWSQAACWLTVATLTKGYPLALVLLLVAIYFRRLAPRFSVAMGAGLLLPFVTQAPSIVIAQNLSWFRHLQDSTVILRERQRSLDHLFELYHHPFSPHIFTWIGLSAGAFALVLCRWHARNTCHVGERLTFTYMMFAVWVALFGPATETCTYVVVAPAIAWSIVEALNDRGRLWSWSRRAILVSSLLLMGPFATDAVGPTLRDIGNAYGSQPIGALLFLGYLLPYTWRRHARQESAAAIPIRTSTEAAA
jgi:hypothetical protein